MITRKARKALRNKRRNNASIPADPYLAGDAARHAGQPASANPHPVGSEDAADWRDGWLDCDSWLADKARPECDTCEVYGECVCLED